MASQADSGIGAAADIKSRDRFCGGDRMFRHSAASTVHLLKDTGDRFVSYFFPCDTSGLFSVYLRWVALNWMANRGPARLRLAKLLAYTGAPREHNIDRPHRRSCIVSAVCPFSVTIKLHRCHLHHSQTSSNFSNPKPCPSFQALL